MILGIDASNIRGGGGITYLSGLLRAVDPGAHGFSRIIVWSGRDTLSRIDDRPWLVKSHQPKLDKGLLQRTAWQRFRLSEAARSAKCDLLFVPGGSYAGDFTPIATISRNMLPFQWRELRRYGVSWRTVKFIVLRWTQSRTFRKAGGLIFLTRHAEKGVMKVVGESKGARAVIPHGVDDAFSSAPREQKSIGEYSKEYPLRILYVSTIDMYKHQWAAAEAVAKLRSEGVPVSLELVGPAYPPALNLLEKTLRRIDPAGEFVEHTGAVPHGELRQRYLAAEIFLFASTCENLPNILIEAMASGLPIACSDREPMPEVLGDAGVYFDPERPEDIVRALRELIDSPMLRAAKAEAAVMRARAFSSARCVGETFRFLSTVARAYHKLA